jgi:hypothetical protein
VHGQACIPYALTTQLAIPGHRFRSAGPVVVSCHCFFRALPSSCLPANRIPACWSQLNYRSTHRCTISSIMLFINNWSHDVLLIHLLGNDRSIETDYLTIHHSISTCAFNVSSYCLQPCG